MKKCKLCGFEGEAELFRKNARTCKPCNNAYLAANYQANREKRLASQKDYYAENRENTQSAVEGMDEAQPGEASRDRAQALREKPGAVQSPLKDV